jgi:hypothetical protein
MIVRIRFGNGRRVSSRKGKNSHAARVTASLLGLVAICLGILGFWRLGEDLGIAGDFVFSTGFLSHWQVWLGASAMTQYASRRLIRYARPIAEETNELPAVTTSASDKIETPAHEITARV